MARREWVWMPHPGHFICGFNCRFRLNTYVPSGYIVSTVGEYFPDEGVREILAKSRGVKLEGIGDARRADYMKKIGYEELGYGRKYETMVFRAGKSKEACCPYEVLEYRELDFSGYNARTPSPRRRKRSPRPQQRRPMPRRKPRLSPQRRAHEPRTHQDRA